MPTKKKPAANEKRLADTLSYLQKRGLKPEDIVELVHKSLNVHPKEEVKVPLSAFSNEHLGSLETIVKYLRENLLLTYQQIAELTNRNKIALAVSYRNARIKMKDKFPDQVSPYSIPVSILKDRKLSVLENIAWYLKNTFGLTYHKIAVLMNRDDRTIWTVYQRAQKKKK
ncbi:hypothetical protein HYX09_05040 [Candidatus Woesearchaeota archaeon]|nr:hypothetical protein [Candidatus Woesearchaeota archaeon]